MHVAVRDAVCVALCALCAAVCCSGKGMLMVSLYALVRVAVYVAVCCSVLQCVAGCGSVLSCVLVCCSVLQCFAFFVYCSVL